MKKTLIIALLTAFAGSHAFAADGCEAKAVSKEGKPLAGAAKTSFMKKCEKEAGAGSSACATKAMSKEGKPLAGAAKTSFMKKCAADEAASAGKK